MLGLEGLQNEKTLPQREGTKLAKIVDGEFLGFYDEDVHNDLVFEENTPVVENSEPNVEGEIAPMIPNKRVLKPEYQPISDIFWNSLLEGQSIGKEIRVLKNGKLGLYERPVMPQGLVKPEFNYVTEMWEETATKEEQLTFLDEEMVKVDMEIEKKQMEINSRARRHLGSPTLEKEIAELQAKMTELENRHMNVSHIVANEIEDKQRG